MCNTSHRIECPTSTTDHRPAERPDPAHPPGRGGGTTRRQQQTGDGQAPGHSLTRSFNWCTFVVCAISLPAADCGEVGGN